MYVPLDSWGRLAAQTAEQLAGVAGLHDARPQLEGEGRRRLAGFLPERVRESLATAWGFGQVRALDLRDR